MNFLKNTMSLDRPIYTVYIHPVNKHQRLTINRIANQIKIKSKGKTK